MKPFNPQQLEDDTDVLWEEHVRRDFKKEYLPLGEESWRRFYFQLKQDRDNKLKAITSGIKQRKEEREKPGNSSLISNLF